MKKMMKIFAVIAIVGFMFMPSVSALELNAVTIEQNTDSVISATPIIEDNDLTNITITYNGATLKMIDANADGKDRGSDAAWVGFKLEAPTGAGTAKVKISGDVGSSGSIKGADADGIYYFGITAEKLQAALNGNQIVSVTYEFDWDCTDEEQFEVDQTVTININAAKIIVLAKDSDEEVFNGPKEAAKFAPSEVTPSEGTTEATNESTKNDENPDTSDMNIYAFIALLLTSGIGLTYSARKIRFN